jgi:hypothetical protein
MCAVSPDSKYLAFITEESEQDLGVFRVHLFEKNDLHGTEASVENSKLDQSMVVECAQPARLQFSPDGRFLHAVFILNPGTICGATSLIWDVRTGRRVNVKDTLNRVRCAETSQLGIADK